MNTKTNHPFWALYYDDDGFTISGDRIMGRQAAGHQYLQAVVNSDIQNVAFYVRNKEQFNFAKNKVESLLPNGKSLKLTAIPFDQPDKTEPYGGIFLPGPNLSHYSMHRSYFGDNKYSLVGITHTTASHTVMSSISNLIQYPVMPWDALICTSEVVADTINRITEQSFLEAKKFLGAKSYQLPMLPVIPLGVHNDEFDFDDIAKAKARKDLGIDKDDIVVVYVGRLSFHAKAHPVPMYLALESCAKEFKGKKKIHLIQTGWFANDFIEKSFKDEAKQLCPNIECHFLDGKIQDLKRTTLAAGDIFMSLSDNQQETFGLTPLEGMASGMPVIVSDWNGYKSTVRDKIDGFRVRTISLGKGAGRDMAYKHMVGSINYDAYIGFTSQRVAVDIAECINKLKLLINDREKRLELGNNAKQRAKESFAWSYIIDQYKALAIELNDIRANSKIDEKNSISYLHSDRMDPFDIFSTYPTKILDKDIKIKKTIGLDLPIIKDLMNMSSISFAIGTLPDIKSFEDVLSCFNDLESITIDKIKELVDLSIHEINDIIIVLLKYGYLMIEDISDE